MTILCTSFSHSIILCSILRINPVAPSVQSYFITKLTPIVATTDDSKEDMPPSTTTAPPIPSSAVADADSDPDFDDLDDVLDQFNSNAPSQPQSKPASSQPQSNPTPSSSGPGRPCDTIPVPSGPEANESEEDFMARLTKEMSDVMSKMGSDLPSSGASPEDLAKMGKELEEFTYKMETEGIKPEDLLKAILGEEAGTKISDEAHKEHDRREIESESPDPKPTKFEDRIRKTMERMEESGNKATSAAQSSSEEDMLASLMKALETEGGEGEGDLSKMLHGMMQELTNKDMLYEPMKELDQKFPDWLAQNKVKLKKQDYERYEKQQVVVKEITTKFEEKGFNDDKPECRTYIWEQMQKMQALGAPPEDLIQNPLPGMGLDAQGLDEGCPTQ